MSEVIGCRVISTMKNLGLQNCFAESGTSEEIFDVFGLRC